MPLAPIAGLGETEDLSGGRPHPVGGHHIAGAYGPEPGRIEVDVVMMVDERHEGMAVAYVGARHPSEVDQRCVEFGSRCGGGEHALPGGQRHADLAARW